MASTWPSTRPAQAHAALQIDSAVSNVQHGTRSGQVDVQLLPGARGMRVALSCIAVAAGGNPRRMSFRNVASARAWGLSGRRVDGRRAHACGRLWFALILFVPGAGIAIAARHFAARTRASASQCPCNATRGRRPGARPFGICCIADGPIVLTFTAIAGCAENRRGVQHHACHPS